MSFLATLPYLSKQMRPPEFNEWLHTRAGKFIQYLHAGHIADTCHPLGVVTTQQVGKVDQLGPVQAWEQWKRNLVQVCSYDWNSIDTEDRFSCMQDVLYRLARRCNNFNASLIDFNTLRDNIRCNVATYQQPVSELKAKFIFTLIIT